MRLLPFPRDVSFKSNEQDPAIDVLTYAIGDIHGRFDLFKKLVHVIKADAAKYKVKCRVVLLGDYVDRGPDSKTCLDGVIAMHRQPWCHTIALKGNHEQVMIDFLDDPLAGAAWLKFGGLETLRSYGISPTSFEPDEAELEALHWKFNLAVPAIQRKLLRSLKLSYEAGDYFFVHAGVDPRRDRETQTEETLLWIRDAFLKVERACAKSVVHGHTPSDTYTDTKWRIGVDTGAYATGVLTAVRLNGTERHFIQVR